MVNKGRSGALPLISFGLAVPASFAKLLANRLGSSMASTVFAAGIEVASDCLLASMTLNPPAGARLVHAGGKRRLAIVGREPKGGEPATSPICVLDALLACWHQDLDFRQRVATENANAIFIGRQDLFDGIIMAASPLTSKRPSVVISVIPLPKPSTRERQGDFLEKATNISAVSSA